MNKVQLGGHLGKDPEVRYLPDGKMVTSVNMATSNDYKKGEEWVKRPASWHWLVAFGDIAEALAKFQKGAKIEIEGKITYKQWGDKDGNKKTSTEIQVWKITGASGEPVSQTGGDQDVPF